MNTFSSPWGPYRGQGGQAPGCHVPHGCALDRRSWPHSGAELLGSGLAELLWLAFGFGLVSAGFPLAFALDFIFRFDFGLDFDSVLI